MELGIQKQNKTKNKLAKKLKLLLVVVFVLLILAGIGGYLVKTGKIALPQIKTETKEDIINNYLKPATTGESGGKTLDATSRQRLYKQSAEKLSAYTADNPTDQEALSQLAGSYYNIGQFDNAISAYNKLIALDPNQALYYTNIAHAYLAKGDSENAKTNYQKSISLDPSLVVNYMNLAMILKDAGNKEGALSILDQGLEKNPDNWALKDLKYEYEK